MLQWLIIGLLYFLGFGFFGLIGGLSSAGDAFRSWGESAAARRGRIASSS
jgi:hypothetical protein